MLKIYLIGDKCFIWNAEDVMKLRREHRIVGFLTGVNPSKSFQVKTKWLPLQLMPEEATLLVEKDKACLSLSPEKITDPILIDSFLTQQEKLCKEQAILLKQSRQKIILEKADEIYAGKKRKLLKNSSENKKKAISEKHTSDEQSTHSENQSQSVMVTETSQDVVDATVSTVSSNKKGFVDDSSSSALCVEKNVTDDSEKKEVFDKVKSNDELCKESNSKIEDNNSNDKLDSSLQIGEETDLSDQSSFKDSEQTEVPVLDKEAVIAAELAKIPDMDHEMCMVQLFTECPLKSTVANGKLKYPSTDSEKLRYAVFKDLWEKNYYVTSGAKFGGDFLAYEGDPIKYHASFIVVCMSGSNHFQALDVLTYGRLGHQVKKTVALASMNEFGIVEYITINWSNDLSEKFF